MTIFRVRQKSPGSFGAFLLKPLQDENTAVSCHVREQRNGCVVFALASGPPQSFVLRLLTGERFRVHESFRTFPDRSLTFAKVELVFKKGDPWVGRRASDQNVVSMIQVPYFQVLCRAHRNLLL